MISEASEGNSLASLRDGDPEDIPLWEHVTPRISNADLKRFETNLAEILPSFGMDLGTAGTVETPFRLLKALFDSTAGYEGDPKLLTVFPTECRGGPDCRISQVIEGPISTVALCEQHALRSTGRLSWGT